MKYETIIDPGDSETHLNDADWAFVDCRIVMRDPDRGQRDYEESHIAGAVYAHLDRDLSGPVTPAVTGRHPLPAPEALVRTFCRLGIGQNTQVVAYDESNGSMAAARLWWLLKWAGHESVAVLNGGFSRWLSLGLPCASGVGHRPEAHFTARFRDEMVFDADQVLSVLEDAKFIVLDSRTAERYQGLNETIDAVAGHIRGAFSAQHKDNVNDDGSFKPPQALATRFQKLMGGRDASHTVFYCGSGVTAAHNILACAYAGLGMARLYPGSWSEWITDPGRPIATGGFVRDTVPDPWC